MPVCSDEVDRQGILKCRMSHIWKMLKAKGIEPLGERDYPILNGAVHASPWGALLWERLAWRPGPPPHQPGTGLRRGCLLLNRPSCSKGLIRGRFTRSLRAVLLPKLRSPSGAQSKHATTLSSRVGTKMDLNSNSAQENSVCCGQGVMNSVSLGRPPRHRKSAAAQGAAPLLGRGLLLPRRGPLPAHRQLHLLRI